MTAPADAPPTAAVVIPHFNDTLRLGRCLAALAEGPLPAGIEIVVADNGSSEDVASVLARHPGVRLVTETARGAGPARNRGAAETTAPRLLFLDSDCVPCAGWVAAGIAALEGRSVVGGSVGVFDETPPPRSGPEALETVLAFDFRSYIETKGFTGSGNMAVWRAVFEEVGGFGTGVSEDVEWSERARARGHRIHYAPEFRVLHPTRPDWPALRAKWLRITREMFLHRLQRAGARPGRVRAAWALRALLVAGSPVRDIPRILRHPDLRDRAERARAVATLLRLRALRLRWMLAQAFGREIR